MNKTNQFSKNPNFTKRDVDGDSLKRSQCGHCGFIDYQNPKVVIGSAVRHGEKILMCKRAIEPRAGFWTLPAGYMELGETLEDGAKREAWEEACIEIEHDGVLGVFSLPHISQVQVMFRSKLKTERFAAGPESLEVALFSWQNIPWKELAFPSVVWTLAALRQTWNAENFAPMGNPPEGRFGFPLTKPPID